MRRGLFFHLLFTMCGSSNAQVTLEDETVFLAPPGSSPALGWGLDVGDANGDGVLDVALSDDQVNLTGAGWVLIGPDFSGVHPLQVPGLSGQAAFGLGVWRFQDLNADGFDDVLCAAPWADVAGKPMVGRVFVFYGPTFQSMTELALPVGPFGNIWFGMAGAAHDYTGDGKLDLVIGTPLVWDGPQHNVGRIDVYSGATGFTGPPVASFRPINPQGPYVWGYVVEVADFDGNGAPDLLTREKSNFKAAFRWLKGFDQQNTLYFEPPPLTTASPGSAVRVVLRDLNGDGALDLITGDPEYGPGQVAIFYGPTFSTTLFLAPQTTSSSAKIGIAVDVGDVNRDEVMDVVAGAPKDDIGLMNDAGRVTIFFGPTFAVTQDIWEYAYSQLGYGARLADLDGDGFPEILVGAGGEWGGGALHILKHHTLRLVGEEKISLSSGGFTRLSIEMGALSANAPYFILMSVSGSEPGLNVPYGSSSFHLPLNFDAATTFGLQLVNTPTFQSFQGLLDASGSSNPNAKLVVPSGVGIPALIGTTLTFAAVLGDAGGSVERATHAVEVTLDA